MPVRRPPQPRSNRPSGSGTALGASLDSSTHAASRVSVPPSDPPEKEGKSLCRAETRSKTRKNIREAVRNSAPNNAWADTHDAVRSGAVHEGEHESGGRSASRPARTLRSDKKADWTFVWEGQKKSHQLSLRAVAVLGFAALAVLIVITPLRSFIAQQEQIRELKSQVQTSKEHIEELKESIALWNDPAYVQAQARERLGYVMPGQTLYIVTGGDADPQEQAQAKVDKANEARRAITPFYVTMWDSISVAGQASGSENPQNVPVINEELAKPKSADQSNTDMPSEDLAEAEDSTAAIHE